MEVTVQKLYGSNSTIINRFHAIIYGSNVSGTSVL
jgi:hypothetical protein